MERERTYQDDTCPELLEQAQANLQAVIAGTLALLQRQGIPAATWIGELAVGFSTSWGEPEPWRPDDFLDAMLTNLVSMGAKLVSEESDESRASAVFTGFPDPSICAANRITPLEMLVFLDVAAALAFERGLNWSHLLEPAGTRVTVVPVTEAAP